MIKILLIRRADQIWTGYDYSTAQQYQRVTKPNNNRMKKEIKDFHLIMV